VDSALESGYRLLDCAAIYKNEREIGVALSEAMTKHRVPRSELFVISKVYNDHHGATKPWQSLERTLADLQLDYLDMLLLHWPIRFIEPVPEVFRDAVGRAVPELRAEIEFLETWKALEEILHKSGRVRAIGVSNFTVSQLEELMRHASVAPAMNQVEFHPYLVQQPLLDYCRKHQIVLAAYSPLGSPATPRAQLPDAPTLLREPLIVSLAQKYGRTNAQVILRWGIEKGIVVLPKSVTPERIRENAALFDWSLSPEDQRAIDALNRNWRYCLSFLTPSHFDQ
jgi:diketogulonate reductase-like aldo/keto reductase